MDWQSKYIKYKTKYIKLKSSEKGGGKKKLKNKTIKHTNYNNKQGGMEPKYIEHLSEPWFTLISMGLKTVEGRKNKGKFKEMVVGDIIKWTNDDFASREVMTRVISKQEYRTFQEYLESEGLDKCLPGIKNMETGLSVYFKYFTKEDEDTYGVVAIRLELI